MVWSRGRDINYGVRYWNLNSESAPYVILGAEFLYWPNVSLAI